MRIENAPYMRCDDCRSLFMPADPDVVEAYKQHEAINTFRREKSYQEKATERRAHTWDELLFWIRFRAARFLGQSADLDVIDVGNHYIGLSERIQESPLCKNYCLTESILPNTRPARRGTDIVLYLDQLTREADPASALRHQKEFLRDGGLMVVSTRVGSGFDVLMLRENARNIIPYEHATLPSLKGLESLLEQAGLQVLEVLTPGTLDVKHVAENIAALREENLFIHDLFTNANKAMLAEFQGFLQKNGMSSHARIVAKNVEKKETK